MKKRSFQQWISVGLLFLILVFTILPNDSSAGEYRYDNYFWLPSNLNLTEKDFSDICFVDKWDAIIATSENKKIYVKKSFENHWNPVLFEENLPIESVILDPKGKIILQTSQHLLIKNRLDSEWKAIELPMKRVPESKINILSLAEINLIVLIDGTDIWILEREEWHKNPNPNQLLIQSMAYDPEKMLLIVGALENGLWTVDWKKGAQNKLNIQPINCSITQIFLPNDYSNTFFATTNQGDLYRSLDQGQTWEKKDFISKNIIIYDFCEDETRTGVFFTFTKLGVYLTADQGTEWIPMQHGIEGIEAKAGCYYPVENRFYITTTGKGIRCSFLIPNQPAPMSPKEGEDVFYFKPTLSWELFGGNSLPGSYHVIVSSTSDFKEVVFEKQNIMGDSTLVPENILKLHKTYFWKVRVETQYWISDWSAVYSFVIRQRWTFTPNQTWFRWNEKKVIFHKTESICPFLDGGAVYLPVRAFLENLYAKVDWNPQTEEILILFKGKTTTIPIHSNKYSIQIKQNRSYIPVRYLAEIYLWTVEWDARKSLLHLIELS